MPSPISGVAALDRVLGDLGLDTQSASNALDALGSLTRTTDDSNTFDAAKLLDPSAEQAGDAMLRQVQQYKVAPSDVTDIRRNDAAPTAEAKIKQEFAEKFADLARDPAAFHEMMREVYGENYDVAAAEGFRQAALRGDFSWLPKIEFKSDATLQGANGAYDSSNNVVYINEKFVSNPSLAADVYLEEAGHFLDTKLNRTDAAGDEGEMFRRLANGEHLSAVDKASIRAEDDHGTLIVDGKEVAVEFWNPIKAVVGAVESVVTGAVDAVVGAVKNSVEAVLDVGRGVVDIFKGDFLDGLKKIAFAPFKFMFQTPLDALLMMGAKTISSVQILIGVETAGRKLTPAEIADLKAVYGDSIDYDAITVKEGDVGLLGVGGHARTIGNTIYVPKDELPLTQALLTHEMGHVWQFQNGGTDYMSEALWGQSVGEGYDFEKGIKEGKSWEELNPEQQAELLEQAWKSGFFSSPASSFIYKGTDYTDYLTEALKQVRRGDGA